MQPGRGYLESVFPGALVFGLGLVITVAPLTTAVLAAVDDHHLGVGSAFNNAVARIAGLLAVAALPLIAGLDTASSVATFDRGFRRSMLICAAICAVGGVISWVTIRRSTPVAAVPQASVFQSCHDPCVVTGEPETPGRGLTRSGDSHVGLSATSRPRGVLGAVSARERLRVEVRILVVDDEAAVRGAIRRALTYDGYEVDVAADGAEALEVMAATPPDALVVDVLMPRVDGLELCRRLREAGDRTPILILTARHLVSDRVAGSTRAPTTTS